MPRPPCCRRVGHPPPFTLFKPAGLPAQALESVSMGLDEYEALRLADMEQLPHDQAASLMRVSRQTFGRILETARAKVASVLVLGRALRIEGGPVCPPPGSENPCPRWGSTSTCRAADCPSRLKEPRATLSTGPKEP